MTTPVNVYRAAVKADTVNFIKGTLQEYARENNFLFITGRVGTTPVDELDNTCLKKEYCNLEYPAFGHRNHFYAGVILRLLDSGEALHLEFVAEYGDSATTLDLTEIEKRVTTFPQDVRKQVITAATLGLQMVAEKLNERRRRSEARQEA